jgi:hypothetical protein
MADAENRCARCLEFEEEIRALRHRLAASGQYVTYSPGPNTNPDVRQELRRWVAISPTADGASGLRAGWLRLSRFIGPKLCEWESRWKRAIRDQDRLKAPIGVLVTEVERLRDSR